MTAIKIFFGSFLSSLNTNECIRILKPPYDSIKENKKWTVRGEILKIVKGNEYQ